MTKQEAISKIKELGFTANLWEKAGKQRIYVDFTFSGSPRRGGFIGNDKTELVAQPCGKHTPKYQEKLDEIAKFEIEWSEAKANDYVSPLTVASNMKYAARMARKESETQDWEHTHDL